MKDRPAVIFLPVEDMNNSGVQDPAFVALVERGYRVSVSFIADKEGRQVLALLMLPYHSEKGGRIADRFFFAITCAAMVALSFILTDWGG